MRYRGWNRSKRMAATMSAHGWSTTNSTSCLGHDGQTGEFDHVIRPKGANYAFGVSRADGVRIPETN